MSEVSIPAPPDEVTVVTDAGAFVLEKSGVEWVRGGLDVRVSCVAAHDALRVTLEAPTTDVRTVHLQWRESAPREARYLGDHWERGYGDLEWRGLVPERILPWYYLRSDKCGTFARGVKTGAAAIAHWRVDGQGAHLYLDVRSGGVGVRLGNRSLDVAHVVQQRCGAEIPAFAAAQQLCARLCDDPILPPHPVYGGNNWYYAYGHSSHEQILRDADLMASLAPAGPNRPYMVIDDGWQIDYGGGFNGGPWDRGNAQFPDMPRLARQMVERGTRPGIWVRPLAGGRGCPERWRFARDRFNGLFKDPMLDPSIPEVLDHVAADIGRLSEWGFELIKHDFTTYDICGLWGFEMPGRITADGWSFADRSRTTAEIVRTLYRTIHRAAGKSLLIGCNTIGHLSAGLVQIQRTGDDTSGREWERTRKMGINTLAFRMPQHDRFFAVDADCVGLTDQIPWRLNEQWLRLLAGSGTPLFVSADPKAVGVEQRAALKEAFARASVAQPVAEPLDWMETTCPSHWRIAGTEQSFAWGA